MFVYLHGFASSPASFKARHFASRLAALGIETSVPALDGGDFEHLTLTGQLALLEREVAGGTPPVVLIGSSMGGYLAALHAARHPVAALVLMAPAVDFARRWRERTGLATLEKWRREGRAQVFHHAQQREVPIAFDLMDDAERYEAYPRVNAPALVLHGRRDDVVPQDGVERFAAENGARLVLFDSGHELVDCADAMFEQARDFLASVPAVASAYPALKRAATSPGRGT